MIFRWMSGFCCAMVLFAAASRLACAQADPAQVSAPAGLPLFVNRYCADCHAADAPAGNLSLTKLSDSEFALHPNDWEKVVRKLRNRQMPPVGHLRPTGEEYAHIQADLESSLDEISRLHPQPGRTDTFRRLTRNEYRNAIRDLLDLNVDVTAWLPADESSHGFDNITVGDLSPTLLERYITAAQKIARLAVGSNLPAPDGETVRLRADLTQEGHVEGLPLGTRGGVLISKTFPQDGQYEFQIRLTRDRNEEVEGLKDEYELEVLIDRERVHSFTVAPPPDRVNYSLVDRHLTVRIPVTAGPHEVGVTFPQSSRPVLEQRREPLESHFNFHRHPRQTPAIYEVTITGPFSAEGPGDTPSRRRIFAAYPPSNEQAEDAARIILMKLARRAFRRPVTEDDVALAMQFYRDSAAAGFETGIEAALTSILVSPHFLFRVERQPEGVTAGTSYRISDVELASRLSFFLWSSIPDDELLSLAEAGTLHDPEVLSAQVSRMLADPRSRNLAANFASQWLYLKNLDSFIPEQRLYPDFDDNLRQALRTETEMLFEHVLSKNRSVLELINADYTFLNERLAKHYGIPHIYGERFRQVDVTPEMHRGGLLRQGSILTVTSYATRTSPVVRGNWVLKNILGAPAPPPPADVPDLKEATNTGALSVRERLAEHRANPACAGCHDLMDPVGFALENFDAIGRWRETADGQPLDATGSTPDGRQFVGVDGLEASVLERPELFVATLTEKLLTFGLGRGVEFHDAPAVRQIVRDAAAHDNRFASIVTGIATSVPFQMRTAQ